jgi:hypothetical protein
VKSPTRIFPNEYSTNPHSPFALPLCWIGLCFLLLCRTNPYWSIGCIRVFRTWPSGQNMRTVFFSYSTSIHAQSARPLALTLAPEFSQWTAVASRQKFRGLIFPSPAEFVHQQAIALPRQQGTSPVNSSFSLLWQLPERDKPRATRETCHSAIDKYQ